MLRQRKIIKHKVIISRHFVCGAFSATYVTAVQSLYRIQKIRRIRHFPAQTAVGLFQPVFSFFRICRNEDTTFIAERKGLYFHIFTVRVKSRPATGKSHKSDNHLLIILVFKAHFSEIKLKILHIRFIKLNQQFIIAEFVNSQNTPSPKFRYTYICLHIMMDGAFLQVNITGIKFGCFFTHNCRI